MIAGNQIFQKQANLSLVMRTIQRNKEISRVDISRELGLKKSTVTNIVGELLENNVIKVLTEGKASSQGGRKPVILGINKSFGLILGIELQPKFYRAVITDMDGTILVNKEESINFVYSNFSDLFFLVLQKIQKDIDKLKIPLIGIGLAIPGFIDVVNGVIIRSWSHDLTNYDFIENISKKINIPVFIDNDSNCCAWRELWFDDEEGNFIYVLNRFAEHIDDNMGQGIGVGIVINGDVYYGSNYESGEFKSIFWRDDINTQVGMNEDELSKLNSDSELLRKYLIELLSNFSVIISILNPKKIFFGGSLQGLEAEILDILEKELKDSWISHPDRKCDIFFPDIKDSEVASGAAGMVLSRLFAIPQLGKTDCSKITTWESTFNLSKGASYA